MKMLNRTLGNAILLMFLISGCGGQQTTPRQMPDLPTAADKQSTAPTPGTPALTIAHIQGASHISTLLNEPVENVQGVVTVLRLDGFYMESQSPDDDAHTSEGIFVFTETVPLVKPGDLVEVSATVREIVPGGVGTDNLSITTLDDPLVEIIARGMALPAPTILGLGGRTPPDRVIDNDSQGYVTERTLFDPEEDGLDFYESLESMRVQINHAIVVGPTNQYKEIVVVADGGVNATRLSSRGGLVLQELDANPERIILDDRFIDMPLVQTGDFAVDPIVGVVDYDYGNFKIQSVEPVQFESGGLTPQRVEQPVEDSVLRIADYNVENLSAQQPDRMSVLAEHIVNHLDSPDIISLQEIQDNNGAPNADGVAADETYLGMITAIQELGGPAYGYVNIDPKPGNDGGIPGGNIRVGYLYRLDRGISLVEAPSGDAVSPVEVLEVDGEPVLSLNPGRVDPRNPAWFHSRKPLAAAFKIGRETLFLINNHFHSKGGDSPLFGDVQPPKFDSEEQRLLQGEVVADFVAEILAIDPAARIIVMGDLNDFQFSATLKILSVDLENLVETLPVEEQYTYIFEGNSQTLDHMLVSEGLLPHMVKFEIVHINSEFDYLTRFSDHDVLLGTFNFDG